MTIPNYNEEQILKIIDEYVELSPENEITSEKELQSKGLSGLEKAIKSEQPDKYSTYLFLSFLSEWEFINNFKEVRFNDYLDNFNFEDLLKFSTEEYYQKYGGLYSYQDKPTRNYEDLLFPNEISQVQKLSMQRTSELYLDDKIELSSLVKSFHHAFKQEIDDVLQGLNSVIFNEFTRALYIADKWVEQKNEGVAAFFLDYAMFRMPKDLRKKIKHSETHCRGAESYITQSGELRKKLIDLMNRQGFEFNEGQVPQESYFGSFKNDQENLDILKELRDLDGMDGFNILEKLSDKDLTKICDETDDEMNLFGNEGESDCQECSKLVIVDQNEIEDAKQIKENKEAQKKIKKKIVGLTNYLKEVIFEQDHAIEEIVNILANKYSGIAKSEYAHGIIFSGSTGVGKTELARQLNKHFYPGSNLLKIDCSEYAQEHQMMKLIGAPPSYVGYNDGGSLVPDYIRNHTDGCVILFDEIEKAHPKVVNYLLSLFDSDRLLDNQNQVYLPKNVLVLMTTNVGNTALEAYKKGIGFGVNQEDHDKMLKLEALKKYFAPEFLGRIHHVAFNKLTFNGMVQIFEKKLTDIKSTVYQKNQVFVQVRDSARDYLLEQSNWEEEGARAVEKNLEKILTPFSIEILKGDKVLLEDTLILERICEQLRYGINSKDKKQTIYFLKKET